MGLPSDIIRRGTRAAQTTPNAGQAGILYFVTDETKTERWSGTAWESYQDAGVAGAGDVVGPSSATDNALARFDTTTGKLIQNGVITESDTGALTFPDNIRQTMNPGADAAGINVGAVASDPGTLSNGDLWYNSTAEEIKGRINGVSVTLGRIVQVVNTQTGAVATGTTQIPLDDTIPQNTEGTEYMTLAITPTHTSNKLLIEVQAFVTSSLANWITMALFQDTTANALAAITFHNPTNTAGGFRTLTHYMDAGTTSATTFKVRIGQDGAATTVTFNGQSGGRLLGGVMASSITITEILV